MLIKKSENICYYIAEPVFSESTVKGNAAAKFVQLDQG